MKSKEINGFERVCSVLADSQPSWCVDDDFIQSMCDRAGISRREFEMSLYETFGMSSSEIMHALNDE